MNKIYKLLLSREVPAEYLRHVGSTMKIDRPRQQCIVLETKASFIETPNSAIIIKDQGTDDVNRHIKATVSPANLLCGTSVFDTSVMCMLLGKEKCCVTLYVNSNF